LSSGRRLHASLTRVVRPVVKYIGVLVHEVVTSIVSGWTPDVVLLRVLTTASTQITVSGGNLFCCVFPRILCALDSFISLCHLLSQIMIETLLHLLGSVISHVLADDLLHPNSAPFTVENSRPDSVGQPGAALAPLGVTVAVKVVGLDVDSPGYELTSSHRDMSVNFLGASSRYTCGGGHLSTFHDIVIVVHLQVVGAVWVIGVSFSSTLHGATF
jgi:hypothetical protein